MQTHSTLAAIRRIATQTDTAIRARASLELISLQEVWARAAQLAEGPGKLGFKAAHARRAAAHDLVARAWDGEIVPFDETEQCGDERRRWQLLSSTMGTIYGSLSPEDRAEVRRATLVVASSALDERIQWEAEQMILDFDSCEACEAELRAEGLIR